MVEDRNARKTGGCTVVLWKSHRVLIEKEVPKLVLADNDFSMPDHPDGWTWNRSVTKDKWSEVVAESQTGEEDEQHDLFFVTLAISLIL